MLLTGLLAAVAVVHAFAAAGMLPVPRAWPQGAMPGRQVDKLLPLMLAYLARVFL